MYYRRKVILALLQLFDGSLDKIKLQKLLFLFTREQEKPSFDFVPYMRGCFSFQSYADFRTMGKYNMIGETSIAGHDMWAINANIVKTDYLSELTPIDKKAILKIKEQYGDLSPDELMKLTYRRFPYFAIKSQVAHKLLSKSEFDAVRREIPTDDTPQLFTIGYEGISLEAYLNKLLKNNVKVLCDVRNNPISMKYGFSKSQLQHACEGLGVKYVHIPELGIASSKRKGLKDAEDYTTLFKEYEKTTLRTTNAYQKKVIDLIFSLKRIALTCFEADPCMCHRSRLAKSLAQFPDWKFETVHL